MGRKKKNQVTAASFWFLWNPGMNKEWGLLLLIIAGLWGYFTKHAFLIHAVTLPSLQQIQNNRRHESFWACLPPAAAVNNRTAARRFSSAAPSFVSLHWEHVCVWTGTSVDGDQVEQIFPSRGEIIWRSPRSNKDYSNSCKNKWDSLQRKCF